MNTKGLTIVAGTLFIMATRLVWSQAGEPEPVAKTQNAEAALHAKAKENLKSPIHVGVSIPTNPHA